MKCKNCSHEKKFHIGEDRWHNVGTNIVNIMGKGYCIDRPCLCTEFESEVDCKHIHRLTDGHFERRVFYCQPGSLCVCNKVRFCPFCGEKLE